METVVPLLLAGMVCQSHRKAKNIFLRLAAILLWIRKVSVWGSSQYCYSAVDLGYIYPSTCCLYIPITIICLIPTQSEKVIFVEADWNAPQEFRNKMESLCWWSSALLLCNVWICIFISAYSDPNVEIYRWGRVRANKQIELDKKIHYGQVFSGIKVGETVYFKLGLHCVLKDTNNFNCLWRPKYLDRTIYFTSLVSVSVIVASNRATPLYR